METPLKKKTEEGKVNENTGLRDMSGLSTVLRKTVFKSTFIVDIYFDTSKCRFRGVNKRLVWRDLHDCHTLGGSGNCNT